MSIVDKLVSGDVRFEKDTINESNSNMEDIELKIIREEGKDGEI